MRRGRQALGVVWVLLACGGAWGGEVKIVPESKTLPANHLKFYLQFPAPMERGEVFLHLRLVKIDARGGEVGEVPEPFREVELWDETFTRLTLWFHPGRQKPGVNLNVEIGPILEEGNAYRLEISGNWRDETGTPLGKTIRHEFRAGAFDDKQPDPRQWKVRPSAVPLIETDDQLDPVSLQRALSLREASGKIREDLVVRATDDEMGRTRLQLGAEPPLAPGRYVLIVDPALEDLAGNSVARPFNLDLEKDVPRPQTEPVELPFEVPAAASEASQGQGTG